MLIGKGHRVRGKTVGIQGFKGLSPEGEQGRGFRGGIEILNLLTGFGGQTVAGFVQGLDLIQGQGGQLTDQFPGPILEQRGGIGCHRAFVRHGFGGG